MAFQAHERSPDGTGAQAGRRQGGVVPALRRAWPVLRYVLGLGLLAVALWVLSSHRSELSGLSQVFDTLNWWWVPPAVIIEMASFFCFAGMQKKILRCGGLTAPWPPLVKMTFGAQAIANSLPGGTAASTVYAFRWFRRFGADTTLTTWSLAGTVVASIVSLSLVATVGLGFAAELGASLDLIPVIIGVLLVTVAMGALFIYERPLARAVSGAIRVSKAVTGRPRGNSDAQIQRIVQWITKVRLGWREVNTIVLWGVGNWLLDCACFAMMFLAVHAPIPWKGLLLAYGAGQLAATLPITPGGLGAVEGSITIALVAFGGVRATTVDAVLIYRLISFWLILVIGWALCGELALQVRRGRWDREALGARVVAGVDRTDPAAGASDIGPGLRVRTTPMAAS
jgi:hypothetical protein